MTLSELRSLVYANLAEVSSDSFFSSTTINKWINQGYRDLARTAWNYEKSVVLSTTAQGATVNPGSFRYTSDSGATYTNRTSEVTDGSGVTLASVGGLSTLANGDWIVVGAALPFTGIAFTMVGVNPTASELTLQVWGGSDWITITATDGTEADNGASLGESGTVSWEFPDAWPTNTVDSYSGFHVRLSFSAGLNAATSISEVTLTSVGSRFVTLPSDFRSVKMVTYNKEKIDYVGFQEFDFYSNANSGYPMYYCIRQDRLYLDPIPNLSGGYLQLWYYAIPAELSGDSDSPVIPVDFHRYLSDYATFKAFQVDGLLDQAQLYYQEFKEGSDRLKKEDLYHRSRQMYKQVRQEW